MESWPPEFTLRKSAKAKRPSIRINVYQHIEVVVPQKTRFFDPLALLNEHKCWILKQLAKSSPRPDPAQVELPSNISFPGLGQEYQLIYQPTKSTRLSLRAAQSEIKLLGNITDKEKVKNKLIAWLNEEAVKLLHPLVMGLNELHEFSAQDLSVRFMKTRWGSCNRNGKITLNSQLAFFPMHLIQHVILHELCHTRYMSHGPRFWALLNKLDPQTAVHDKALSQSHQYLPQWCIL